MRQPLFPLAFLLLPIVAACSGGASTSPGLPITAPVAAAAVQRLSTPVTPGANDLLYISNDGSNSITVYNHGASGNTAPLYTIAGNRTSLSAPGQLAEDSQGNLYVANGSLFFASALPGVLVFAHGAKGNAAPIRIISGSNTKLTAVLAMTVDPLTNAVFVSNKNDQLGNSSLLAFSANANGNVSPYAYSSGGEPGIELANDSTGKNIIELHSGECCSSANFGITFIGKYAAAPAYGMFAFGGYGLADDATTGTYLVAGSGYFPGIARFKESTVGHGGYLELNPTFNPGPESVINNACRGQLVTAPGPYPNTYVVCREMPEVQVYTNAANGNDAPLRVLTGSATLMNQPYGIFEGR